MKPYFAGLIHNINNIDSTSSLFSSWQELKDKSSSTAPGSLLGLTGIIRGWTGCQKHSLVSLYYMHISTLRYNAKALGKQYLSSPKTFLVVAFSYRLSAYNKFQETASHFKVKCHLRGRGIRDQIKAMCGKGT